jgi:hypothetical protein
MERIVATGLALLLSAAYCAWSPPAAAASNRAPTKAPSSHAVAHAAKAGHASRVQNKGRAHGHVAQAHSHASAKHTVAAHTRTTRAKR